MAHENQAKERRLSGVVGFFSEPNALVEAMTKVRAANWQHFDAYTPYPIHGLEHAQGLKRSPLPYVTFVAGIAGTATAFLLQYWTSAIDWPINVGGKPFNSWPAFVPVMFELTVLFAGLATVGAMFLLNGLPNTRRRVVDPRITRDRFALIIEAPPVSDDEDEDQKKTVGFRKFAESDAADFLRQSGAQEVRTVYAEGWF